MPSTWSVSDKRIVKIALLRAQKRAEEDAVKRFKTIQIGSVNDLWSLELKIRQWRKECGSDRFYFSYDSVEKLLGECLSREWLLATDLSSLSESRLGNIRKFQCEFSTQRKQRS